MDLLERYLHAVRFWLPRGQQDDIVAELSEDLRSEANEREAALGRPLDDAELVELLKRRGEPMRVAAGFLPQRSLIGPALFPLYVFVLKILAACIVGPWVLVAIGFAVLWPELRGAHPGWIAHAGQSLLNMAIATFGFATLVFAVLERTGTAERWWRNWDPRKLPARRDPSRIPRVSTLAEIAIEIVFLLWWAQLPQTPSVEGRGVRLALGTVWPAVYWTIFGLVSGGLALSGANLLRPWWTAARAWVQLALNAAGLVPVALLFRAGSWVEVTSTTLAPERLAAVSRAIHLSARVLLFMTTLAVVAACVQDVVRLARLRRARPA